MMAVGGILDRGAPHQHWSRGHVDGVRGWRGSLFADDGGGTGDGRFALVPFASMKVYQREVVPHGKQCGIRKGPVVVVAGDEREEEGAGVIQLAEQERRLGQPVSGLGMADPQRTAFLPLRSNNGSSFCRAGSFVPRIRLRRLHERREPRLNCVAALVQDRFHQLEVSDAESLLNQRHGVISAVVAVTVAVVERDDDAVGQQKHVFCLRHVLRARALLLLPTTVGAAAASVAAACGGGVADLLFLCHHADGLWRAVGVLVSDVQRSMMLFVLCCVVSLLIVIGEKL